MLIAGLTGGILVQIYAAIMQREFQNTDNQVGKGFAVLGIYLFAAVYCMFFILRCFEVFFRCESFKLPRLCLSRPCTDK